MLRLLLFLSSIPLCHMLMGHSIVPPLYFGITMTFKIKVGQAVKGSSSDENTFRINLMNMNDRPLHLKYYIKTDPIKQDQAVLCAQKTGNNWTDILLSRKDSINSGTEFSLTLRFRKEMVEIFHDGIYRSELSSCFLGAETVQSIINGSFLHITDKLTVPKISYGAGYDDLPAVKKLDPDFRGAYFKFTLYVRRDFYRGRPWLSADFIDKNGGKVLKLKFSMRNETITEISATPGNAGIATSRQRFILKDTFKQSKIFTFQLHYEIGQESHGFKFDDINQWSIPHNNLSLVEVQLNADGIDIHDFDVDKSRG